jgi:hypothetical protein
MSPVLVLALALVTPLLLDVGRAQDGIAWTTDLAAATRDAAAQHAPLFVVFRCER